MNVCINGMTTDEVKVLRENLVQNNIEKKKVYSAIKRVFDILISFVALIALSPAFLIVALVVCIDDPHGGPLYKQERVGRNGKKFQFYKFRSMVVGAEDMLNGLRDQNEKTGPVFKMHDDPRITRVGRFIRKTSIDELPQLWNVLKGDMSLVGPRPAPTYEVEQYDDFTRLRLLVTPGLTCYWQVAEHRDEIGFEEWMKLDVDYIKDRNFLVDLKLILLTFRVSFTGQGM